ncbi:MAG: hypothetical protein VX231_07905 [Pseudomonadota bacterium]|nr:hypothetical protein [Pseudomonadota bacterium]
MKAITQYFFSFTNNRLKQLIVIVACISLQACEARHHWILIIYNQNSLVTSSFSIDGYDSKQACQQAAKLDYPEERFLCILEDDIG